MFKITLDSEVDYEGIHYSYSWIAETENIAREICEYLADRMGLTPSQYPNSWNAQVYSEYINLDYREISFATLETIKGQENDLPAYN